MGYGEGLQPLGPPSYQQSLHPTLWPLCQPSDFRLLLLQPPAAYSPFLAAGAICENRKWLETGNTDLGKTVGIRWLRKKTLLLEEGKKTSSAVLYLEKQTELDRVRLGGKWLRMSPYEQDRGRK
ncbi:hypothetical protein BDZ91DRAFT_794551 [Kalaharituber pfeilii]|nr:hypothetical protein BDZ91DRAFT_794551 [Kalaharituber pfeilii]